MTENIKKIENDDGGTIWTDGDADIDPSSMYDVEEENKTVLKRMSLENRSKQITLIKDGKEYNGKLKKFILKETGEGNTSILVVFDLNS